MKYSSVFLLSLLLLFAACSEKIAPGEDFEKGTIIDYTGLDGCGFLIEMNSGQKYEPLNLKEFIPSPSDGQKIRITYVVEKDYASICMVGEMIRIKELKD